MTKKGRTVYIKSFSIKSKNYTFLENLSSELNRSVSNTLDVIVKHSKLNNIHVILSDRTHVPHDVKIKSFSIKPETFEQIQILRLEYGGSNSSVVDRLLTKYHAIHLKGNLSL
tara:strand:- start:97 stop:435 length:339 start_codon:yes stop_codon:yes gene_type:complete